MTAPRRSWLRAKDALAKGKQKPLKKSRTKPQSLRALLALVSNLNRWQHAVLSAGFQEMLSRRAARLKRLKAVLAVGLGREPAASKGEASLYKTPSLYGVKLEVLTPLPLFSGLAGYEMRKLASCMRLKLVARYTKVLRAASKPPAFFVVLWGSLRYATIGPNRDGDVVGAGGTFGEGALAAMGGGGDGGDGAETARQVPVEIHDLEATSPTLLLCLRPSDIAHLPWFVALQRRYVNSELKSQMLLQEKCFKMASKVYCRELADLFTLIEPPAGHTLFVKGEKPDHLYLLTHGTVRLEVKPDVPEKRNAFAADFIPPAVVVANILHAEECPWVGEESLFCRAITADARRTHNAVTATPCQLLALPRASFPIFERMAPAVLHKLKLESRVLEARIAQMMPEEEDKVVQLTRMHRSGTARSMATAAHLRYHAISQQRSGSLQAQTRDERSRFILGLVTAYGKDYYEE